MAEPEPHPDDRDGDLYDAYLDAALRGAAADPDAFLALHPQAPPAVRARVAAMHRLARRARRSTGSGDPPGDAAAEPGLPHERLGEFRLLRRIGAGGMGLVYEAEQESLRRRVAVKVLRPDLRASPEARTRFEREARAVARLRHPGIVSVLASGEQEGVRWIAMDLAAGSGADECIDEAAARGGAVAPARAARWAARLARALEYAHSRGVIHRDVKPSNVRIGADDEPLLLDFGIARDEGSGGVTLTGPFVGSLPWAAPEQVAGAPVDGRVDVYGVGAFLYHCLTGRPPVEDGNVDRAIHRLLHEEPPPPRRLAPAVPRDLDVVVRMAMERDPARRYASAGALAEDLEAVLDFRPVRARPPGPVRRTRAWARAHPAAAAGILACVAAATALASALVAREVADARALRTEAAAEVDAARAALRAFGDGRARAAALESELSALRESVETTFLRPEQDAFMDAQEDALHGLRRAREEAFHGALDHLRRAERLDPAVEGTEAVRALLYVERWRDAEAARDSAAAEFYRGLALSMDGAGALTAGVFGLGTARVLSEPQGAEVHLFRFREHREVVPGGEPRLVPVPRRPAPVAPGALALRVIAPAPAGFLPGDLVVEIAGRAAEGGVWVVDGSAPAARGDRVLSADGRAVRDAWDWEEALRAEVPGGAATRTFVLERAGGGNVETTGGDPAAAGLLRVGDLRELAAAGGVPARVLSGGGLRDAVLPEGIEVRATAIPLPLGAWSLAGRTPLTVADLEPGWWLAVVRLPGREDARVLVEIHPGVPGEATAVLLPAGASPPGFVRVQRHLAPAPFWIQEREVTCAEYLRFLNDPETLAALDGGAASGPPRLVPRNRSGSEGGHWTRGADGRFGINGSWRADWPVIGLSQGDALAYAAWRTRTDAPLGGRGAYGLPTLEEWLDAGHTHDRYWVFGTRFRPRWIKSCFSRPRALPEPVLRFPRDESVHGVFDMSGGAAEWLEGWLDEARGLRRLQGGCWAWGKGEQFKTWAAAGWPDGLAGDEAGLRLVLRGELP